MVYEIQMEERFEGTTHCICGNVLRHCVGFSLSSSERHGAEQRNG